MTSLIDNGARVSSKDSQGMTPLFCAARLGHKAVVKLLIDKEADVNCKTATGYIPLHLSAFFGHMAIAKLLIDKGVDVNSDDSAGFMPLYFAILKNHQGIVEILERAGASRRHKFIKRALEQAQKQGIIISHPSGHARPGTSGGSSV